MNPKTPSRRPDRPPRSAAQRLIGTEPIALVLLIALAVLLFALTVGRGVVGRWHPAATTNVASDAP